MSGKQCAKSAAWLNRRAPELKRPSTLLCVFVTLLNDRVSESLVFPLLPFLLASFTSSGTRVRLTSNSCLGTAPLRCRNAGRKVSDSSVARVTPTATILPRS